MLNDWLDELYQNVGERIKGWAKWIFLVEAISAISYGIYWWLEEENFMLGIIIIILGPIAAYVASWILYGFGEIVDKTSKTEAHAKIIKNILTEQFPPKAPLNPPKPSVSSENNSRQYNSDLYHSVNFRIVDKDTVICNSCGCEQPIGRSVCFKCGAKFKKITAESQSHAWRCDKCGKMRTKTPCEHCGKE